VNADKELAALLKIVEASRPESKTGLAEFKRAFVAVGFQFRQASPNASKYFHTHIAALNEFLAGSLGWEPVSGYAAFAAIVAHNDVSWRAADARIGQMLEVALDPHSGRPCANAWRGLLAGEPLRPPLARRPNS